MLQIWKFNLSSELNFSVVELELRPEKNNPRDRLQVNMFVEECRSIIETFAIPGIVDDFSGYELASFNISVNCDAMSFALELGIVCGETVGAVRDVHARITRGYF